MPDSKALVPASPPPSSLGPALRIAEAFASRARAPRTLKEYAKAWAQFERWCETHQVEALPAQSTTLRAYLAERTVMPALAPKMPRQARKGALGRLSPASLNVHLSAICRKHFEAGHASPRLDPELKNQWEGIRREVGVAPRNQSDPLLASYLPPVVTAIEEQARRTLDGMSADRRAVFEGSFPGSEDLGGLRDRAALLVGFACGCRRAELVALNVEDLDFTPEGVMVHVRKSKTDPHKKGAITGIPHGGHDAVTGFAAVCPVCALRDWLSAADIRTGPIFRPLDRYRRPRAARLAAGSFPPILKSSVEGVTVDGGARLDAKRYSAHSLRSGMATSAAKAGKSDRAIMRQGRWKSAGTLDRYIRPAQTFDADNALHGLFDSTPAVHPKKKRRE